MDAENPGKKRGILLKIKQQDGTFMVIFIYCLWDVHDVIFIMS